VQEIRRRRYDGSLVSMPTSSRNSHCIQDKVGWRFLVRGFAATNWSLIQETCAEHSDRGTGDIWCSKVCLWLLQQSYKLWILRNSDLHDDMNTLNWKYNETREQVKLLYENSKYMDADDRIIFNIPLETRLTHPPETLQTWVKNMEPVLLACMKKQETRIRTQHNDIRSYFITQDIPLQESSTTEEETEHNEDKLLARNMDRYYKQNSDDNPSTSQSTPTIQTVKNDNRTHTEEEGIYILQPSRELHLPDRVETPCVGDTDRAASQQE
jgi:hypothetical protein